MNTFYNIKAKNMFALSTNKAVVRKPKLSHCTLDKRRWIKSQGLIELRRISIKKEDETNPNKQIHSYSPRLIIPKEINKSEPIPCTLF